jgi:hypothetical protein
VEIVTDHHNTESRTYKAKKMSNTDPPKTAVNSGALSQEQSEDTKEEQTMQSITERDKKCATKHYIDIKD